MIVRHTQRLIVTCLAGAFALALAMPTHLWADAPPSYTLDQCIARALAENVELKAFERGIDEGDEGINEALADFLPSVGMFYGDTRTRENKRVTDLAQIKVSEEEDPEKSKLEDLTVEELNLLGRDETFTPNRNIGMTFRLSQPLFTGFSSVIGLVRAKRTKEYREFELHVAKQRLIAEIRGQFYNKIRAQMLIDQLQQSEQRLELQRAIASAWVEQKLVAPLRLVEIGVELSDVRHRIIRAVSEDDIATVKLKELMGLEDEEALHLSGSLRDTQPNICKEVGPCRTLALKQRPELVLGRLGIEIARQDADAALSGSLPRASLDASWVSNKTHYYDPVEIGDQVANYSNEDEEYMTLMLNISFTPIQQGGKNFFTWRKQRAAMEKMRQQLEKQRRAILSEVEIRLRQARENSNAIAVAREAVAAAREAYEMNSRSAKLGVVSLKELLDAELRLSEKEISLINSQHGLMIAYTNLQQAIGEAKSFENDEFVFLTPQNIEEEPTFEAFVKEPGEGSDHDSAEESLRAEMEGMERTSQPAEGSQEGSQGGGGDLSGH